MLYLVIFHNFCIRNTNPWRRKIKVFIYFFIHMCRNKWIRRIMTWHILFQNPIIVGLGGSYFDTFIFLRFSQFGIWQKCGILFLGETNRIQKTNWETGLENRKFRKFRRSLFPKPVSWLRLFAVPYSKTTFKKLSFLFWLLLIFKSSN